MTPQDIDRVRRSWALIEPRREETGRLFYARLFESQPATRTMFRGEAAAQSAKLMATLNVVVEHLDKLDDILPAVRLLGQRHRQEWQVVDEMYDWVRDALLWSLQRSLGDAFDAGHKMAWSRAYERIAGVMKQAADEAPPAAGSR
jgi:nitric oxide dioxygenase